MVTEASQTTYLPRDLRQFVKFGTVGVANNVVDYLVWRVMMSQFHLPWLPAQLVAFVVSVSNSFLWNSLWTFKGVGSGRRHAQYVKFFAVNIVSLGFNLVLMKGILIALSGHISHTGPETITHLNIAKAVAIVCGAIWNYTLNKRWTFK